MESGDRSVRDFSALGDACVRQGCDADADRDRLGRDAARALRLTDFHWRFRQPGEIERWGAAYACGVRFRERHRAA